MSSSSLRGAVRRTGDLGGRVRRPPATPSPVASRLALPLLRPPHAAATPQSRQRRYRLQHIRGPLRAPLEAPHGGVGPRRWRGDAAHLRGQRPRRQGRAPRAPGLIRQLLRSARRRRHRGRAPREPRRPCRGACEGGQAGGVRRVHPVVLHEGAVVVPADRAEQGRFWRPRPRVGPVGVRRPAKVGPASSRAR